MANIEQISPAPTSQSNSISTARVPTLLEDGSNWTIYRESFRTAIFVKGLRRYLDGMKKQPIPTLAYGVNSNADENYEKAVDRWTANHTNIKLLLLDTIPKSLKLEITTMAEFALVQMVVRMQEAACRVSPIILGLAAPTGAACGSKQHCQFNGGRSFQS